MNELKARYRNKLKKVIIEVWNGQKWLYVKTLSNPLEEFKEECLAKVSLNKPNTEPKEAQKFAQSPLTAPLEKDTNKLEKDYDLLEAMRKAQEEALRFEPPKKKPTKEELELIEKLAK